MLGRWKKGDCRAGLAQQFFRSSHIASCLNWPLIEHQRVQGRRLSRFSDQLMELQSRWKPVYESRSIRNENCPSKYVLSMFPYPSGSLHIGHMRVYTISDVTARYYRLNGFNVIHPIGWDAFGLPAENAAMQRGIDPREWTLNNIATMKRQLLETGIVFDWDRELCTCDPSYYHWTQWIFLRLYERGLLRRSFAEVNWDPVDNTVLAAEQIDSEGRSWRSGAIAEKRKLRQWMVETPRYATRLSEGLRRLSDWHDVADIQSNWIGKCDVYRFMFPIRDDQHQLMEEVLDLRVGDPLSVPRASFIIIRQGHPLSDHRRVETNSPYLLGISVLNGISGAWMPVVVVPEDYDGPEMHLDARFGDEVADSALAEQFGIVLTRQTLMPMSLCDVQELASFGRYGGYMTSRTLQDWVVSRQRAWGTPIPVILSTDGKTAVPLMDDELPLHQQHLGQRVACDRLKDGEGFYETDTLDTFFDSAWYYLRFLDPTNSVSPLSPEAAALMPVDVYVGGIEHAAVHMFFARFISYFLTDIGLTLEAEPFRNLIPQGIVRGKTYRRADGKYVPRSNVVETENKCFDNDGNELRVAFEKMSKSKGNGVDPQDVLQRNGIDMTRLQLLDSAAPRQAINWEESDLKGLKKWLDRVAWIISAYVDERRKILTANVDEPTNPKIEESLRESYNFFVRNVSMCLEVLNLHNTALARLQGFTNALRKTDPSTFGSSPEAERCVYALITMMQVYTPYTAAEMWAALRSVPPIRTSAPSPVLIDEMPWPQVDPDCEIDFILCFTSLRSTSKTAQLHKSSADVLKPGKFDIPCLDEVNGTGCGRVAVPRLEIEHLSLENLIERAKTQEHRGVMQKLEQKNFVIESITSTARKGFHVTVNVTLKEEIDPREISQILNELMPKWKSMCKKKKSA